MSLIMRYIGARVIPSFVSRKSCLGITKPRIFILSSSMLAATNTSHSDVIHSKQSSVDILLNRPWIQDLIQLLKIIVRTIQMTIYVTPLIVTAPFALYITKLQKPWLNLLILTVQECGPVYVKLGQWASTRRDLFPPTLCDHLSQLQRQASVHSWSHTNSILEKYGFDNFEQLSSTPIGSGCCAQVYKAKINSTPFYNKEVAIKILHPDIKNKFLRDLTVLRAMVNSLSWVFPQLQWLSIKESLEEFAHLMNQQADLRNEAQNLKRFCENFKDDTNVIFPKPLFCKEDILIETYEPGVPIGNLIQDIDFIAHDRRQELASKGINMFLKMVFSHNFVHADLHPGNILVREEQLVILDPGLTATLSKRDKRNFVSVFSAVVKGDGVTVGNEILQQSEQECENPEQFVLEIESIVLQFRSKLSFAKVNVSQLLTSVFDVFRKHHVKLDPNFTSVILSIMVIEGLGKTLDPDVDLLRAATPFLLRT